MFANTVFYPYTDHTRPYRYSIVNDQRIYNTCENDPLTDTELCDLEKSIEDIQLGRCNSFDDKSKLLSFLDDL